MKKRVACLSIILCMAVYSNAEVIESAAAMTQLNLPIPAVSMPSAGSPASAGSEKISLDLRGMDIMNVLKILSQKGNLKIVTGRDVRGSVTLFIDNVDVMTALQIVLEMNDLAYEENNGLIKVISAPEYERKYGRKFRDPRQTRVIQLKYAKPEEMLPILSQVKSASGQLIQNGKSNSIIVIDLPDIIQQMEQIVAETDQRERQVLIDAKIVQVMLNDQFQIGVNWNQVFSKVGNEANSSGFLNVNLGNTIASGGAGIRAGMQVGSLTGPDNYNALLSALQTVGKTDLVSSPHISVMNNREARILVGTKEAYVTTTVVTSGSGVSTTAESVTFIDVGMKLYVTPVISKDGFVMLKIRPEVSSVNSTLSTSSGNKIPIVRTSESETTISVKDGVTLVIAGLIEEKNSQDRSMVPFLGKIPVLGYLFGGTSKQKTKTELVILLTPHIISGEEDITSVKPVAKK